jgi:uncharacterized damage-inducible protein DinB
VGGCLLAALVLTIIYFSTNNAFVLLAALGCGLFVIPFEKVIENMHKKISYHLKALDHSRQKMLEHLQNFSQHQLTFRPDENRWSMLDVINHLVLAEQRSYHFMANQRDPNRMPQKLGWDNPFRVLLMIAALRLPLKYKKPANVPGPQTDKDLEQLTREWQDAQAKLTAFVESLSEDMLHIPIFIHPFFKFLNIAQTLLFLREHIDHHLKQVKRIARSTGFPVKS